MRKNLAALYMNKRGGPEKARTTSCDTEKSTANKLRNRQNEKKKQDSLDCFGIQPFKHHKILILKI